MSHQNVGSVKKDDVLSVCVSVCVCMFVCIPSRLLLETQDMMQKPTAVGEGKKESYDAFGKWPKSLFM